MDNTLNKMRQAAAIQKQMAEEFKESRKLDSNNRLKAAVAKKIRTSMIASLAQFEERFGSLWGHGLTVDECSESQLEERRLWSACRQEILDKGNAQIRAIDKEIALYDVEYIGYRNTFNVKQG